MSIALPCPTCGGLVVDGKHMDREACGSTPYEVVAVNLGDLSSSGLGDLVARLFKTAGDENAATVGKVPDADTITREVMFLSGDADRAPGNHEDCHPDSPCRKDPNDPTTGGIGAVGLRGLIHNGETYLSREDLMNVLSRVRMGYHNALHAAQEADSPGAIAYWLNEQAITLLGNQLFGLTNEGNASDPTTVPDDIGSLLSAWDTSMPEAPAAPLSPLDRAIADAKAAAEQAKKDKNEETP